jgi:hypothetical protein
MNGPLGKDAAMKTLCLTLAAPAIPAGCRAARPESEIKLANTTSDCPAAAIPHDVNLASFDDSGPSDGGGEIWPETPLQPPSIASQPEVLPVGEAEGFTIECLQQMALANNPEGALQ